LRPNLIDLAAKGASSANHQQSGCFKADLLADKKLAFYPKNLKNGLFSTLFDPLQAP